MGRGRSPESFWEREDYSLVLRRIPQAIVQPERWSRRLTGPRSLQNSALRSQRCLSRCRAGHTAVVEVPNQFAAKSERKASVTP